jgi:putative ABC transport system substrate-binding protein
MKILRREFVTLLAGAAVTPMLGPLGARAQVPALPVIGYLGARSLATDGPMLTAFRQGLGETGYQEGKNVAFEFRWAEGRYDRLPALADDLVRRNVAIIVTSGGEPPALVTQAATSTTPVVFNVGGDPVESGLVASLNRPAGNLTGVSSLLSNIVPKQLGLLAELLPKAAVIGVLLNPEIMGARTATRIAELAAAGRTVGRQIIIVKASSPDDIDAGFASFVQQRADALLVTPGAMFVTQTQKLIALAARHALPTMYFRRELVDAGGLISYASSTAEGYSQQGVYAGRILKGERPSDLPVVQPTKYELIINLKTAKALGLNVPPMLLARADEVIE